MNIESRPLFIYTFSCTGCNLFVFHIPNKMTTLDLFNQFERFGNILSARIMVDKQTGRNRGFGFVSFDNQISAQASIKGMNGFKVRRSLGGGIFLHSCP
jgi:CUG-BP- and ETR3-like factor